MTSIFTARERRSGRLAMIGDFQPSTLQVSTDTLLARDRVAFWREQFGRKMFRCEFEPLTEDDFHGRLTMRAASGLRLATIEHSPMRVHRTPALIADGDDDLVLQITATGTTGTQRGREIKVDAGEAVLSSNGESGTFISPSPESRCMVLALSRHDLDRRLDDVDAAMLRPIAAETPALRLLKSYVGVFHEMALTPEFERLAVGHVYDLVAVLLGAGREAGAEAEARGLRSARLRAAKLYVLRHLADAALSPAVVAAHLGVTPHYVHMLFEPAGVSFAQFVLGRRLLRARRLLADPPTSGRSISEIAFDAGFADLSTFNRNFRRRFGCTPTEMRGGRASAK